MNTGENLKALADSIASISIGGGILDSLTVVSYSSPEGNWWYNVNRSKRCAAAMRRHLEGEYPELHDRMSVTPDGEAWHMFRQRAMTDTTITEAQRVKLLSIIDSDNDYETKKQLIKDWDGALWNRIVRVWFKEMRRSFIRLDWTENIYTPVYFLEQPRRLSGTAVAPEMRLKPVISPMALIAVLAVSCVKTERLPDGAEDRHTISWQTVQTKAAPYSPATPFVSWAWYLPEGKYWVNSHSDAELYISGETVSFDPARSVWSTGTPYYWPEAGRLSFMSLSPADIGGRVVCSAENGIVIDAYDVKGDCQDIDLMVADVVSDQNANIPDANGTGFNGVPTVFRHKLARITGIRFNTDDDYAIKSGNGGHLKGSKRFFINSISILGLNTVGTYTSGPAVNGTDPGSWSNLSGQNDLHWTEGSSQEIVYSDTEPTPVPRQGTDSEKPLVVLPQTLSDGSSLRINYTIRTYYDDSPDGNDSNFSEEKVEETINLSAIVGRFAINSQTTFDIIVGLEEIQWSASVSEWEDRTGSETTI